MMGIMSYTRTKMIGGRPYTYRQESFRDADGNVKTRHLEYIGPGHHQEGIGTTTPTAKPFKKNDEEKQYSYDKYDLSQVEVIGKGSDRIVGRTPEGHIIKVAITPRGLIQNESEGDYVAPVPKLIDSGEDYVIVEDVERDDKKSREMLKPFESMNNDDFKNKTSRLQDAFNAIDEKYDTNTSDLMSYELMFGDMKRASSWGWKDGKPVLIDAGTLNDVSRYRSQEQLYKDNPYVRDDWNKVLAHRQAAERSGSVTLTRKTRIGTTSS